MLAFCSVQLHTVSMAAGCPFEAHSGYFFHYYYHFSFIFITSCFLSWELLDLLALLWPSGLPPGDTEPASSLAFREGLEPSCDAAHSQLPPLAPANLLRPAGHTLKWCSLLFFLHLFMLLFVKTSLIHLFWSRDRFPFPKKWGCILVKLRFYHFDTASVLTFEKMWFFFSRAIEKHCSDYLQTICKYKQQFWLNAAAAGSGATTIDVIIFAEPFVPAEDYPKRRDWFLCVVPCECPMG